MPNWEVTIPDVSGTVDNHSSPNVAPNTMVVVALTGIRT